MNKSEINKYLRVNKKEAVFSHYCYGNLYYNVEIFGKKYQFPIEVVDSEGEVIQLSSDLGTTNFKSVEQASLLFRWISNAIDVERFVKIA